MIDKATNFSELNAIHLGIGKYLTGHMKQKRKKIHVLIFDSLEIKTCT